MPATCFWTAGGTGGDPARTEAVTSISAPWPSSPVDLRKSVLERAPERSNGASSPESFQARVSSGAAEPPPQATRSFAEEARTRFRSGPKSVVAGSNYSSSTTAVPNREASALSVARAWSEKGSPAGWATARPLRFEACA